tara:strand:- start:7748 stop:8860 length:1113 start_codon:yes stop_codon:yes gene_type:complete
MATSYKTFLNNDITSTKTLLHEAVPLTGALVSGTYGTFPNGDNIKNYAHGMFQSVYDYPYLSSSANHIYDLTVGFSGITGYESAQSASCTVQRAKKINLYNQMAQTLMGYDQNGNIQPFDKDGDITGGGEKIRDAIFVNFARLLEKDEIKKGSFTLQLGTGSYTAANDKLVTIKDLNAQNDYRVNSPAGEYGILKMTTGAASSLTNPACGLIFYQAGVAVLSSSIFLNTAKGGILGPVSGTFAESGSVDFNNVSGQGSVEKVLLSSSISGACDNLRHRLYDTAFNNTTELNSTIHFCRANHNDFNYSSNPTYLSSSKIVVKNNTQDAPVSYITTVGLYSADNELLAVAKLSEPLKKDPTNEMTIRVRLDY